MKFFSALLFFFTTLPAFAETSSLAEGRPFHIYAGGGLQRDFLTMQWAGYKSTFEGWGMPLEVGMDIPFSPNFGGFISAGYTASEFLNTQSGTSQIEKMAMKSQIYKLGFYYYRLGVGWGMSKDRATVNQVSVTTGSSENEIQGQTGMGLVNYTFDIKPNFRLMFEGQYRNGNLDAYRFNDISGSIKFYILF